MTKTLIKPVENGDFWEAQNSKCELRLALLSDPDGVGIPPPFVWIARGTKKCNFWPSYIQRGGVISNSSDTTTVQKHLVKLLKTSRSQKLDPEHNGKCPVKLVKTWRIPNAARQVRLRWLRNLAPQGVIHWLGGWLARQSYHFVMFGG